MEALRRSWGRPSLQSSRLAQIIRTMSYASAMPAFKLRVFDNDIVFFRIAEMKPLGNNVAQVLIVRFAFAFRIMRYLFFCHLFLPHINQSKLPDLNRYCTSKSQIVNNLD